jgi:hypothetical protein
MNTRFLLLLPFLLAADPVSKPEASRISLDATAMPLGEAVASVARQANIPIDTERAAKDRPVRLKLENATLWDALDQLARATDHRLLVGHQGKRIALVKEPCRAMPIFNSGPFRFAAREARGRLEFESGISRTDVLIDFAWEPKFKGYFVELDPKSLSAKDDHGRMLTVVDEGSTRVPVGDSGLDLAVKLKDVPRTAKKLAELTGTVKIIGTSQLLQFAFDPASPGDQNVKKAEVTATLKTFRKNVRLWTAVIELQYPKDMPEFESFQSFLLDNEAWLLAPDGRKFVTRKFELGFERQGAMPITYYFMENDKDGPVLSNLNGWKLVVRVPGRIVEEKVKFQLRDIPLP